VFALPDVVNFFANELPGLGGRRLPFAGILTGAFNCLFFRHGCLLVTISLAPSLGINESFNQSGKGRTAHGYGMDANYG